MYKQAKDWFGKGRDKSIALVFGQSYVPIGLSELHQYFRIYEPINFHVEVQEDGSLIAVSDNYHYGSIITSAKNPSELSEKIKDAILAAFEVPSSYASEAGVRRVGEKEYAFA